MENESILTVHPTHLKQGLGHGQHPHPFRSKILKSNFKPYTVLCCIICVKVEKELDIDQLSTKNC